MASQTAVVATATPDSLDALVAVGQWLKRSGYSFTTVTPATHKRVTARHPGALAKSLQDVFGWSLPFSRRLFPDDIVEALEEADAMDVLASDRLRCRLRCSVLDDLLFFHSAYPTVEADAVFFGPDTYRFSRLIHQTIRHLPKRPLRIVDVCCGAGAGGLVAARHLQRYAKVTLADINPAALHLATANARLAEFANVQCVQSDLIDNVEDPIDLLLANPPYLADPAHRVYRDGGGVSGEGLSIRLVKAALRRLAPGGRFVLYTASAIANGGTDLLRAQLEHLLEVPEFAFDYAEIDPDVFGEELDSPSYASVERIAAVAVTIQRLQSRP